MQRWVDFLKGSVSLRLVGAFPERFLNICAENGLRFWDVDREDECTLTLRMELRDMRRARLYAQRACCDAALLSREGAPPFLARFKRRWALIAGLAAALAGVFYLNGFIWEISVSGAETVPPAAVLEAARQEGVYPGARGRDISPREIKDAIILHTPGLCWAAVNINGSRAEVLVREAIQAPPPAPDASVPADIVAAREGIVTKVQGYAGENLARPGQWVGAGDVLISSSVRRGEETRQVRAMGEVWAVTDREITVCSPLLRRETAPRDAARTLFSLVLGEKRINLYRDYGVFSGEYDIITHWKYIPLPGGGRLPAGMVRQELYLREGGELCLSAAAEEERLRDALEAELARAVGSDGQVFSREFSSESSDVLAKVTVRAVCLEKISLTRETGP